MTELNLKIEPEVIDDLYYQLGSNRPKKISQKLFEEKLIKVGYMMGYNEAKSKFATGLEFSGKLSSGESVSEERQPEILKDYSIHEFLDRDTWTIKYQVNKQPIEDNPYFEQPIFDTWEEAVRCVRRLREYPNFYVTTVDGQWVEVKNV